MWATIWFYLSGSALARWAARRFILVVLREIERRVMAVNVDAARAEVEAKALEAQAREAFHRAAVLKAEAEAWAREHPISALVAKDGQ